MSPLDNGLSICKIAGVGSNPTVPNSWGLSVVVARKNYPCRLFDSLCSLSSEEKSNGLRNHERKFESCRELRNSPLVVGYHLYFKQTVAGSNPVIIEP